uniref:Uncharacterized protein n=1 Tax=Moniliophthora roreri TaxID=221103 RepID=A0A0W0FDG2_MONRR
MWDWRFRVSDPAAGLLGVDLSDTSNASQQQKDTPTTYISKTLNPDQP